MTKEQKTNLPVHVKQANTKTLSNKQYKVYLITTMVLLSVAVIITSYTQL